MFDQESDGETQRKAYDRGDASDHVIGMINPAFDAFELLRQPYFPVSEVSYPGLRAGDTCFDAFELLRQRRRGGNGDSDILFFRRSHVADFLHCQPS